jgi:hypothetical protein
MTDRDNGNYKPVILYSGNDSIILNAVTPKTGKLATERFAECAGIGGVFDPLFQVGADFYCDRRAEF